MISRSILVAESQPDSAAPRTELMRLYRRPGRVRQDLGFEILGLQSLQPGGIRRAGRFASACFGGQGMEGIGDDLGW